MGDTARYDAFITYSHADARVVRRLQDFLEQYRLPGGRRLRVYVDRTDIRSGDLGAEIRSALGAAEALVVCCSEAAARSEWVAREIDAFVSGRPRPVALALVDDDAPAAIPVAFRARELRHSDLRGAWTLGVLRPAARTDLVRLVAAIADVELRTLIPWDRQRRLQRWGRAATALILIAGLASLIPISTWAELPPPPDVLKMKHSIEAAEARGSELVVVTRMPASSERSNAAVWRGTPGAPGDRAGLNRNFSPRSRLLPSRVVEQSLLDRALPVLAIPDDGALFIGEPRPDHFVAVRPEFPDDYSQGDELIGSSDVWVAWPGKAVQHIRVKRLYAEAEPVDPGLFNVSTGIAVAWGSTGLWIGTPTTLASVGGLWRSTDGGASFSQVEGFRSVHSILADEGDTVLVAEVRWPVPQNTTAVLPADRSRIVSRSTAGDWVEFSGPPHGDEDVLELVGRTENGRLIVRVGQTLYTEASTTLGNWLLSLR